MLYSINKRNIELKKLGAILLAVMFLITTMALAADAQGRYHRHRRPSKTKHIAVGTAIGAIGGALIGGRKGGRSSAPARASAPAMAFTSTRSANTKTDITITANRR